MYCDISWQIDPSDRLAIYRLPREERIARLAKEWGPWTDDEMQAPLGSTF